MTIVSHHGPSQDGTNQFPDRLPGKADRALAPSLRRGFLCRCPNCGRGRLFGRFLKTVPSCATCGEIMDHHRADDAPPYFTMLLVGHITIPVILAVQMRTTLSDMAFLAICLPLSGFLALALLQPIKGATVALQWALRMHGFGDNSTEMTEFAEPPETIEPH